MSFDVGIVNNNGATRESMTNGTATPQVYVLFWQAFEDRGILGVYKERPLAEWKKYHDNPDLIRELIGNQWANVWVDDDPDDAIEVWDVK